MKKRVLWASVLGLVASGCVFETHRHSSGDGGAGPGGSGGGGASTSSGPTCREGADCRVADDCSCLSQAASECQYVDCAQGACALVPRPQGTPCEHGTYPNKQCDGAGTCARIPPGPSCFGETGPGSCPVCDDGNPCTEDSCEAGVCAHRYYGIGTQCGIGASCRQGGYCCGMGATCTHDGQMGDGTGHTDCAIGSICLGGKCWISCEEPYQDSCTTTAWPTCRTLKIGDHSALVCQ